MVKYTAFDKLEPKDGDTTSYAYPDSDATEKTLVSESLSSWTTVTDVRLDLEAIQDNETADLTLILYIKNNQGTYIDFNSVTWDNDADQAGVLVRGFTTNNDWKITSTASVGLTAGRTVYIDYGMKAVE